MMPERTKIVMIGPTNVHAMELFWEAMDEELYNQGWSYKPRVSAQSFFLPGRRRIQILGAEKIRRVRGGDDIFRIYLDEVAYFSTPLPEVWRAVRPGLAKYQGGGIAATTPNGKGTDAYDFYLEKIKDSSWGFYSWPTWANPSIPSDEIDSAYKELDEKSFKQEYLATWESFSGLAYYNFNEAVHIKPQTIDVNQPLILHFDFNVNPTTLLLGQRDAKYRIKKEYSFKNSSTERTIDAFIEDFKEHKARLILKIRGDAAGRSRSSNTGFADYHYVEERLKLAGFKFTFEVPASNPPIVDRVKHVNGYLMNAQGESRVEIDHSCTQLIRDLSSQEVEGRLLSSSNNLGHKSDAFGYGIWWDYASAASGPSTSYNL